VIADDSIGHIVETLVLWGVTIAYLIYFLIAVLVTWADRPITGHDEHGVLRVWRDVRQR
jgi:hypothetical protein